MTPERVISAPWLTLPATQAVFSALEARGHTARAVGGIVRNSLLGLPATDIDIATTALPDEVIRLAAAAGLKTIATGLAHGTVTVISHGIPFEVTTLRRDVATDGRHALVAFTDDWAADAARRDFTINALYCSRDGRVFDPLGGMADLVPVKIRFIGQAEDRIAEDYLRILRFFRFSATYCSDGMLDATGLAAAIAHRGGLARISGERIQSELLKLLGAPRSLEVTTVLADSGIFFTMFERPAQLGAFSRLVKIESRLKRKADPVLRLGALGVVTKADVAALDQRLKFSARDRNRLMDGVDNQAAIGAGFTIDQAKGAAYAMGIAGYLDALLWNWARGDNRTDDAEFVRLVSLPDCWTPPVFPLTGADVLALGVAPGPQVGTLLGLIEADWIAGGFGADRASLLVALREKAARRPG